MLSVGKKVQKNVQVICVSLCPVHQYNNLSQKIHANVVA